MAISLEQFVKHLEDSGILTADKLGDFLPPKASPKDAKELAQELVRHKKLTKFQAEEVYKGKGKSLTLGNYVLMEKIGAGGMGQVFKAEHRRMHRLVAIKLLPAAMTKDSAAIARFEREVRAAAKLRHPNIIAADDADQANGVHFLVMELVDGSDLSALVKANGPLPVDKAVSYILQAARGLEFAHTEGIIHRDIKPANLLLDKKGTVKILDMGLARIHGDAGQAELTSTGAVMGTIDYMAPEQALNTKTADARADIYALGCSLYYLLSGRATYDGETLMAKLLAHREDPIPDLRAVAPQVSEQLETIFKKMVAKKTEDRYQTMTAVIADLEGFGGEQTINTQTVSPLSSIVVSNPGLTNFLIDVEFGQPSGVQKKPSVDTTQHIAPKVDWQSIPRHKRNLLIGGGVLGALVLVAVVLLSRNSQDRNRVAKVNGPTEIKASLGSQPKTEAQRKTSGADDEPWKSPAFKKWMQSVAAMPAEQQLTAVKKKLIELNPGFDGKFAGMWRGSPVIEDGVVRELGFNTDHVTDISPVAAFSGLRRLNCSGDAAGKLRDLRPLQGMPLTGLAIQGSLVDDLTPLIGMRLDYLGCTGRPVKSLSPLRDMPLTMLIVQGVEDGNLSALKSMKLVNLDLRDPKIKDISLLKGMPLNSLVIENTSVSDLSPLQGMPLEVLGCKRTPITDLSPLQGMNLKTLYFTPENITSGMNVIRQMASIESMSVRDSAPLAPAEFWKKYDAGEFGNPARKQLGFQSPGFDQWMKDLAALTVEQQPNAVVQKLKDLNPKFDGKETHKIAGGVVQEFAFVSDHVTDISPVRALSKLSVLNCSGSGPDSGQLSDLSPLQGMQLVNLHCVHTKVSDLSPLRGMPLWLLICDGSPIVDLSPLQGLPITNLGVGGTKIPDLSALKGMKLAFFEFDDTVVTDLSPLVGMPLQFVHFNRAKVADLSPLRNSGMPLEIMSFSDTPITDLSPLAGTKLTQILFTPKNITSGMDVIRSMPTIERFSTRLGENFPPVEFWKKYDAGDFGKPKPLAFSTPGFAQWVKNVQAKPAEKQVEMVSQKLQELNPDCDAKLYGNFWEASSQPVIQDGSVVELHIFADKLADLSPIRAFSKLKTFSCEEKQRTAQRFDLSPLSGMKIQTLRCVVGNVDITTIKGLPLTSLGFIGGGITNLRPISGMPLQFLGVSGNWGLTNIEPLMGMKLTSFSCDNTQIANLSPLKDMPLTTLACYMTQVADLSPLKGTPLEALHCHGAPITDFSPLAGLKLKTLSFTPGPNLKGLPALRQMDSLAEIGTSPDKLMPSAEFWKKYDAGAFKLP